MNVACLVSGVGVVLGLMGGFARSAWSASSTAIPDEVTHLRDPFKRPAEIRKLTPKSDLELYSLDQFKLVAVVTGPNKLRAMVEAPNGKSYLIWENQKIGIRKGVVRRITPDAVHVREQVVNVLGQEENVDSELHMVTVDTLKAENAATGTMEGILGSTSPVSSATKAVDSKAANSGVAPINIGSGSEPTASGTPAAVSVAPPVPVTANAPAPVDGVPSAAPLSSGSGAAIGAEKGAGVAGPAGGAASSSSGGGGG